MPIPKDDICSHPVISFVAYRGFRWSNFGSLNLCFMGLPLGTGHDAQNFVFTQYSINTNTSSSGQSNILLSNTIVSAFETSRSQTHIDIWVWLRDVWFEFLRLETRMIKKYKIITAVYILGSKNKLRLIIYSKYKVNRKQLIECHNVFLFERPTRIIKRADYLLMGYGSFDKPSGLCDMHNDCCFIIADDYQLPANRSAERLRCSEYFIKVCDYD